MNKYILIQEQLTPFIEKKKTEAISITTNSIIDNLIKIVDSKIDNNNPLYIILFSEKSAINKINKYLKKVNNSHIYFKIIVISLEKEKNIQHFLKKHKFSSFRNTPISASEYLFLTENSFFVMVEHHKKRIKEQNDRRELEDIEKDQHELIEIGKALSSEKDHNKLLELILENARKITGADAGSIFLKEEDSKGVKKLSFAHAQTHSLDISYKKYSMPLDTNSIAGYVAVKGKSLNYADVYNLKEDDPVSFNSSFDKKNNYRTKSILVVPMKNHIDETIGVLQLINCKEGSNRRNALSKRDAYSLKLETTDDFEKKVVAFKYRYKTLIQAIANQAAIAIENNRMIKQEKKRFDEFINASIKAIEARDPATKGHSAQVAKICGMMADSINKEKNGYFKDIKFSPDAIKELDRAAILHDFGKVYINPAIFTKGKKLFEKNFEYLLLKLDYLYRCTEASYLEKEKNINMEMVTDGNAKKKLDNLLKEKEGKLSKIRAIKEKLKTLNEPRILEENIDEALNKIIQEINNYSCCNIDNKSIDILDEEEISNLSIKKGSLNKRERKEIESHVEHTYKFLSEITWPPELQNIPDITFKHHEKLDGSGYPNKLKGKDNIPIQARMIAIADILDALIASDRPYKKAIPIEKALAILEEEANNNKIDKDLLEIVKKYKIYDRLQALS